MFQKPSTKKKESVKAAILNYLKSEDDEVKAELEAMTGLEYNLHGEKPMNTDPPPVISKKPKSLKDTLKQEKTMQPERPVVREKFEVESQIPFYSSTASAKELQGIIRQQGSTSEDKYKILEARDRLMRLKQVKSHTLETAKVTRGTCPDMCPEKERLMREFQRQVAQYELQDCAEYRICHETAVKQYSRSSADQEEPMPQDLRPVSSLKMTMSYLLHEIVDLCEEEGTNLAEWYHFLWDRTRGIRKDITQQELCCLDAVELVEQCARFHIICSERLGAEETSVFDKKINTENLTKCLQTLKYMYHDLRVKGVTCKNESEFRAYIILLNLNNTNFMWDLQKLPKEIQNSPQVKFAIQVFLSVQSNNYAKFFKLVRETTYLNACILLRYFFQVRVSALSVMVKAYCRTTSTAYPLYEFIDILGFDDENEAIAFCEQAGLNISSDELHIVLNRQNIILPPPLMVQGRSTSLVEAKRLKIGFSIGQVIAGGVMPEQLYRNHMPHNSFNAQGYLKPEAVNASDQNYGIVDEQQQDPYEYIEEDLDEPPPPLRHATPSFGADIEEIDEENEEEEVVDEEEDEEWEEENEEEVPVDVAQSPFSFAKLPTQTTSVFSRDFKFSSSSESQDSKTSTELPFTPNTAELFSNKPGFSFATGKLQNIFAKPDLPKPFGTENASPFASSNLSAKSIFSGTPQTHIFSKPIPITSAPTSVSIPEIPRSESVFKIPEPVKPRESPKKRKAYELEEERKKEEEKIKQERQRKLAAERERTLQRIDREANEIASQLELDVVHDICSTLLKGEIEKMKVFEQLSQKVTDDIIDDFIREICKAALDEEIYIQKRLQEVSNRIQNRIILKYYKIWQQNAIKRREQRKALDNTPVWLPNCSLDACARSLYRKDQNLVIQNMRRKPFKSNNEENLKYLSPVEVKIYAGLKENAKTLDMDPTSIMFWKMVISWPLLENRLLLWRHKKIMSQYLSPSDYSMDPIVKTYKPNPYETLNICIKHCEGLPLEHHVMGMDGLFFIATTDEDPKMVSRRLTKTVLLRQKLMPIPLVFIILGNDTDPKNIEPTQELKSLLQSEYISEYTVHYEKVIDEGTILKLTQTAALWLTLNRSIPVPLEMDYLKDVIDTCLTDELWLRISGHASFNRALQSAISDVKFIIDLHNEAVNRLMDIILDPESLMYTDFPREFRPLLPKDFEVPCSYEYFSDDWKKEENREKIERIVSSFLLPPWTFDWPISDTMELHKCIIRYCHSTLNESNYNTISCNILSNVFFTSNTGEKPNFVHVILEIIREKIRLMDPALTVVYDKNHVKLFRTLPWWFKSTTLTEYEEQINQSAEEVHEEPAEKRRRLAEQEEKEAEDIAKISEQYESICEAEDLKTAELLFEDSREHISEVQKVSEKLDRILEEQRLASKKFEEKLEVALRDEILNF